MKILSGPAVVVPHGVFGVNANIRKTCDELAECVLVETGATDSLSTFPVKMRFKSA